jgi:hypothetical protein
MKVAPMFVSEVTAAGLLDMKLAEFRALASAGTLPAPRVLGGLSRYDVEELRRVMRGEAIGGGPMSW